LVPYSSSRTSSATPIRRLPSTTLCPYTTLFLSNITPPDAVAAFGHGLADASFMERANAAGVAYHDSTQLDRLSAGYNQQAEVIRDRKSTRLNSSHVSISYAVFCLKKKKEIM